MYTNAEFYCPYFQEFSEEVQQLLHDELYYPSSMIEGSFYEHDLGVQGDFVGAAEPIFDEPTLGPMEAAISMMSIADRNPIPAQIQEDENSQSLQHDQNVSDVQIEQYNSAMIPLRSNTTMRQRLLDLGEVYGMRRAFSEGDIKHLGCSYEDRQQKLCRYRNKKLRRNFGRRIKYACRKALADSQPRIRGRFARKTGKCIDIKDSNKLCKTLNNIAATQEMVRVRPGIF